MRHGGPPERSTAPPGHYAGAITKRLSIGAVTASVLLCGAACGSGNDAESRASTAAATTQTTATPERVVLRLQDHGRTVVVSRATNLSLTLGGPYRWSRPTSTGVPVDAQETASDAPTSGKTWELRPARVGTARLRSRGSPACRPATPGCSTKPRSYSVTLIVRS